MIDPAKLSDLASTVLFSREAPVSLYKVCDLAIEATGARNAMVAHYNEHLGYMTLRAGAGADWRADMLGERINVGVAEHEGITAYVAATGKSFVSGNVAEDSHYRLLIEGSRSELASPIHDRHGRVRGVLNVESPETDKFTEEDVATLELLAKLAGMALDREYSVAREEALLEVGIALDIAQNEEELLKRVAEVTQSVLQVTAYSIFLWDEREQAYVLRATVGSSTLSKDAKYLPGEGCTGWVCKNGEPLLLDNPRSDARWRGLYLEFPVEEIISYICVPILSGRQTLGAMRALRKKAKNPYIDNRFTEDDLRLLMAIAEQLGTGLAKLRSIRKLVDSERMAAWGELSARSSHMIGNRVFALAGDVNELRYILVSEKADAKAALKVLDHLQEGLQKLEQILQDYRDFVTATKLMPVEGNIVQVVSQAARSIVAPSGQIKIKLEMDESIEPFYFDPRKIERAVSELVENATHYMEKGTVTVRCSPASRDDLAGAGIRAGSRRFVKIEVEDEGPGIPREMKARIFDPYHSSRTKGMGLGLSIVKGIVDAHEGFVYEAGAPGKGARFVVLIPMLFEAAKA